MSEVVFGEDLTERVKSALSGSAFVVTDANVAALYPDLAERAFVIQPGEKNKNYRTLFAVLEAMSNAKLVRGDTVAALGGGVVGDITGLAAALYMRGLDWINIPTSLLAMVDSGIGGKTAIDFHGVKNLVGAFHLPKEIIVSAKFLDTLPEREWLCGIGELIKTCLLKSSAYALLREKLDGLNAHDKDEVCTLIKECIAIKSEVVEADPKETGLRKILNVGHTVGHALESIDGYTLSHGEYVLKGMMTEFAMCKYYMSGSFYPEIIEILRSFTTPPRTTARAVVEKAKSDKKNTADKISIMLPVIAGDVKEVRLGYDDFIKRYSVAVNELKSN